MFNMSQLRPERRGDKLEIKELKTEKPRDIEKLGQTKDLFMTKRAANDHNANSARG